MCIHSLSHVSVYFNVFCVFYVYYCAAYLSFCAAFWPSVAVLKRFINKVGLDWIKENYTYSAN